MLYQQTLAAIKELSTDTFSGATEIEAKALEAFTYFIGHAQTGTLDSFRDKIATLCIELAQAQPAMASLFNLSNDILLFLNSTESVKDLKESLTAYFTHYDGTKTLLKYAEQFLSEISCIVTHSRSSLVLKILQKIDHGLRVICTESRPLNEGRHLAHVLSSSKVKVTFVVDTAIFSLLSKAECVLVGADAVTPFGLINKIGTMALASVAKDQGIPIYVATSLHKLYPYSLPIPLRDNHEVWNNPPGNIEIKNFYFDITPLPYIDRFFTEKGICDSLSITKKLKSITIAPQLLPFIKQKPVANRFLI